MKKQILLTVLAFMLLVSFNACTSKGSDQEEKNQIIILKNQEDIIKNQENLLNNQGIMLTNQRNVLDNQGSELGNQKNILKKQDSIKDILTDTTQSVKKKEIRSVVMNTTETIYAQLEKTQNFLKIQQKQIDSMIILKIR